MYCVDVENCGATKGFDFIYIYRWHLIGQRKLHTSHNHLGVSGDWWAGAVLGVSGPINPPSCSSISRSKQASFHSFIFGLKKVLGFVHLGWASNLREVKPKTSALHQSSFTYQTSQIHFLFLYFCLVELVLFFVDYFKSII